MSYDWNVGLFPYGTKLGNKAREIVERLKKGESGSALAREYGISRQAVSQLKIKYVDKKENRRIK